MSDAAPEPLGPAQRAARPGPRQPRDQPARLGVRLPVGQPPGALVRAVPHLRGALDRPAARRDRRVHRARAEAVRRHRAPARGGAAARVRQRRGRSAVRRINQMHGMYDISNEDFRYVLATFVVVPKRWMDDFGFRSMTPNEMAATTNYYLELGRHMNIKDLPAGLRRVRAAARRLRARALRLRRGRAPGRRLDARPDDDLPAEQLGPKWVVRRFAFSLMDEPLLRAFRYPVLGRGSVVLPRRDGLRARLLRLFPARSKPKWVSTYGYFRTYPAGYEIGDLGTFHHDPHAPHRDTARSLVKRVPDDSPGPRSRRLHPRLPRRADPLPRPTARRRLFGGSLPGLRRARPRARARSSACWSPLPLRGRVDEHQRSARRPLRRRLPTWSAASSWSWPRW